MATVYMRRTIVARSIVPGRNIHHQTSGFLCALYVVCCQTSTQAKACCTAQQRAPSGQSTATRTTMDLPAADTGWRQRLAATVPLALTLHMAIGLMQTLPLTAMAMEVSPVRVHVLSRLGTATWVPSSASVRWVSITLLALLMLASGVQKASPLLTTLISRLLWMTATLRLVMNSITAWLGHVP
jgi:hypothetical protein